MRSAKPEPSSPETMLPFVVRTIDARPGAGALCCPGCHLPLNLFQPDEHEPSRLLGICDACAQWSFLIEVEPEWRKILVVELPDGATILRALGEQRGRPGD